MKTCHKLILVFLLLFFANKSFAQAIDTAKVNFIKKQFAEINQNLRSYKKVEKADTVESTEGNEILLYYSGSAIKKITATHYGETGKALQEYYFFQGKLIFCYFVDYRYNKPIYASKSPGKIASTTELRIYLDDGKIFLVKKQPSASEYFSEFPADPLKEAKRLLNLK